MKSIPIDFFANVTPNVISAGGDGVNVAGLLLTSSTAVPIGTVMPFYLPIDVAAHFGPASAEAAFAANYFTGYDGSPIKPAYLLIAQFPVAGVAPYLEAGTLATPLATLTALSAGTITISLNGAPVVSGNINLSTATSYSQIASIVQTALGFNDASFTGSVTGNVLTAASITGTLAPGQVIAGAGIGAGTSIASQLTGPTGGAGTYQLSAAVSTPVTTEGMTAGPATVAYSSQLDAFVITMGTPGTTDTIAVANVGGIATALKLTAATGAAVSVGSGPGVPGVAMDAIAAQTQNWVTFTTLFEGTNAQKEAFAAWVNGKLDRYAYVCWSTNPLDVVIGDETGGFAAIQAANYDGVHLQYAPVNGALAAAFIMGAGASIDFTRLNGRRNFAFLTQSGLPADVADYNVALHAQARGVSFYGVFGSAASSMFRYAIGGITGKFVWLDSYINQVWMNDALKLALADLLANVGFIPYNGVGNTKISQHLSDPIQAAVNFGAVQAGVPLSNAQIDEVNTMAGVRVDNIIFQRGWALIIQPASAATRVARASPPILFFYCDGQSVQALDLTSTEVQ